jgi:hypothetical protein
MKPPFERNFVATRHASDPRPLKISRSVTEFERPPTLLAKSSTTPGPMGSYAGISDTKNTQLPMHNYANFYKNNNLFLGTMGIATHPGRSIANGKPIRVQKGIGFKNIMPKTPIQVSNF